MQVLTVNNGLSWVSVTQSLNFCYFNHILQLNKSQKLKERPNSYLSHFFDVLNKSLFSLSICTFSPMVPTTPQSNLLRCGCFLLLENLIIYCDKDICPPHSHSQLGRIFIFPISLDRFIPGGHTMINFSQPSKKE